MGKSENECLDGTCIIRVVANLSIEGNIHTKGDSNHVLQGNRDNGTLTCFTAKEFHALCML